nr:unnamed protein product [Callosobruchus analis]
MQVARTRQLKCKVPFSIKLLTVPQYP